MDPQDMYMGEVRRKGATQTERPEAHQIITHWNRNPLNVLNEMIGSNCLIVMWLHDHNH